jgi:hypothetical protein
MAKKMPPVHPGEIANEREVGAVACWQVLLASVVTATLPATHKEESDASQGDS